eukprot:12439172-Heterocapsa_arctica.AAC.1
MRVDGDQVRGEAGIHLRQQGLGSLESHAIVGVPRSDLPEHLLCDRDDLLRRGGLAGLLGLRDRRATRGLWHGADQLCTGAGAGRRRRRPAGGPGGGRARRPWLGGRGLGACRCRTAVVADVAPRPVTAATAA